MLTGMHVFLFGLGPRSSNFCFTTFCCFQLARACEVFRLQNNETSNKYWRGYLILNLALNYEFEKSYSVRLIAFVSDVCVINPVYLTADASSVCLINHFYWIDYIGDVYVINTFYPVVTYSLQGFERVDDQLLHCSWWYCVIFYAQTTALHFGQVKVWAEDVLKAAYSLPPVSFLGGKRVTSLSR